MVAKIGPKDADILIKFGGGLHTRASEDEINAREAAGGNNFLLDLENKELRPRPPFDLIGTAPNGAEIRGGFSLLKSDGSISTCFQAGAAVYEWDGSTGFTPVGTVNSAAKLRGHFRSHNWSLDDEVLITDLALAEVVQKWNGSTLSAVSFTNEAASPFGTFYAKYLRIANERAVFAHVKDGSGTSPHLIVGAKRGDYTVITVTDRPASALSEEDPFFIPSPDLKPINGMEEAFGTAVLSTEQGALFNLTGESAKDFAIDPFYAGSAASGAEAVAYIGNDIIYGRKGRIESVRDTDRFGDSEADDLTAGIADQVQDYTGWRIVYNARLNRVYLFPDDISECWVFNVAMRGTDVSPWMRWTTNHPLSFRPTFVMSMLDPLDGLEYVMMGDASGNIYRLEGSGDSGDGGTYDIEVEWLTKLFSVPLDAELNGVEGYIKYRKNLQNTVQLRFEFSGYTALNETVEVEIPAITGVAHFGGDYYFGGEVYFGALFENRLLRQKFFVPGQSSEFQVRVFVDGVNSFSFSEIGLRFKVASK